MEIVRTSSQNTHFLTLVVELDKELAVFDGEEHAFYHQFNQIDDILNVVVILEDSKAVACGAIKAYGDASFEIKRMFVSATHRRRGFASIVLSELENWAKELGAKLCVLETGKRQLGANALYLAHGYKVIPNYGPYVGVENSLCYKKSIVTKKS